MTEPYDLRSNIKGKPGSQGTLFQVKDKGLLNPQQRWPKGYTPERLSEVRDALTETLIKGPGHMERKYERTPGGQERYVRYPEAEARTHDTIARSTVPAKHLSGLASISDDVAEGTHGTYWPARGKLAYKQLTKAEQGPAARMPGRDNREQVEQTLIHELGHHADAKHIFETPRATNDVAKQQSGGDRAAHLRVVGTLDKGVGEAVADNYMTEHYRAPGRQGGRATQGAYQQDYEPLVMEHEYPGYNESIKTPWPQRGNLGPQFQQEKLF